MSIGEHLINLWQNRQVTPRRVILFLAGVAVLVVVVLFNQDIINIFRFLAGRAADEVPQWTVIDPRVSASRQLSEVVDVTTTGGERYLYVMGGLDSDNNLLDTVERLELIPATGEPVTGAGWETAAGWGQMKAKRAAFKAFQYQNYLYVVSGDIHAPADDDPDYVNPLLFSTIERLNLNNELVGWQPVAILAGVNFYPEIKVFPYGTKDELHIAGGVYGYPTFYGTPPNLGGDWGDYENLPIIGEDKLLGLPDGGIDDDIKIGGDGPGGILPGGGGTVGMRDDGKVYIAALGDSDNPNLAKMLSDVSKSGDFVTTVSEYYTVNLNDFNDFRESELGNDYTGTVNDTWEIRGISRIGHLRILIQEKVINSIKTYLIDPAPQGRYGHKLFDYQNQLYVIGGATWSGVIERVFSTYTDNLNTFWVIEDDVDPITWEHPMPNPASSGTSSLIDDGLFARMDYQYHGNVAYQLRWSDYRWRGTNPETNGSDTLDSKYAFSTGRAFFGFAKLKPSETETEYMAVGGLENNVDLTKDYWVWIDRVTHPYFWGYAGSPGLVHNPITGTVDTMPIDGLRHTGQCPADVPPPVTGPPCGDWGMSIKVVDQNDRFTVNGWREDTVLPISVYNMSAVGLANQTFAFGGATQFGAPDQPFNNDHVPTMAAGPSPKSFLYGADGTWLTSTDVNIPVLHYAFLDVRTPLKIVDGVPRGERVMVYKVSGKDEIRVETIGPVIYGEEGVPDLTQTTITIDPFAMPTAGDGVGWSNIDVDNNGTQEAVPSVYADRWDYATVTVSLKDYYGDTVDPAGLLVTLYTSRSNKPAVNKNVYGEADNLDDWIRIAGEIGPDPVWGQQQFAVVNSAGEAKFRIGSAVNTFQNSGAIPGFIDLEIYVITTGNQNILDGTPTGSYSQLVFTSHGVPSPKSKLVATSPVKPDGVAMSDITGTLLDWYYGEIPDKKIIIDSNRNFDHSVPPDGYDPNDPNDHWDLILPEFAGSEITDPEGIATFTAQSLHIGFVQLSGYVDNALDPNINGEIHIDDDLGQRARQQKLGVVSTYVNFSDQGEIISLIPSFGRQGQGLTPPILTMEAIGKNTRWETGKTTVNFVRPTMGFFYGPISDPKFNIDDVVIYSDGFPKELGVAVAPLETVDLKIVQGTGSFYPAPVWPTTEIQVVADEEGLAPFQYLPGLDENGIVKIEAIAATSGKVGNLWLPVLKNQTKLQMLVTANPTTVTDGANIQSTITAEAYINGIRLLENPPAPSLTFSFEKDESNTDGTLSKTDDTNTVGWAEADYTRITGNTGMVRVFVSATYGNEKMINRAVITKQPIGGTDPNAVINFDPNDLQINSTTSLNIGGEGVKIPLLAEVGMWVFQAVTSLTNPGNPAETIDYMETHPFTVLPQNFNLGAYIEKVVPNLGYLGTTGLQVTLTGKNTHFIPTGGSKSVVTFTPVHPDPDRNNESINATIISGSTTELVISVDIPKNATPGYWNVKVVTGTEMAEKTDERDFLVTTISNYFVQLSASPPSIPRVAGNFSTLTAKVGYINSYNGSITPQVGVDVTFSLVSTNGGSLEAPLVRQTGSDGKATNKYTTDTGNLTVAARIKAVADLSDQDVTGEVSSTVDVERTAGGTGSDDPNATESAISAVSPVPVDTNGSVVPNPYSTVIVTVRNSVGNPLEGKSVELLSDRAIDVINPSSIQTTNEDGKAIFIVKSSMVDLCTLTANIEVNLVQLTAYIRFEPIGVLEERNFKVTVPFQSRDYDNWVKFALKDNSYSGPGDTNFNETYQKNARDAVTDPNVLADLRTIPFYVYTEHTYTVWAKGKYHLASANTNVTAGTTTELPVSFATANGNKGLLIGDVVFASGNTNLPGNFHDNIIGLADLAELVGQWFTATDKDDLNYDGIVNSVDILYIFVNMGSGATMP